MIKVFISAFTIGMFIVVIGIHAVNASNYDGGGGGTQLPACSSAYWGMTINLLGYRWYCARGADHWVIVR